MGMSMPNAWEQLMNAMTNRSPNGKTITALPLNTETSQDADYKPFMALIQGEEVPHCMNSKGEMVPIREVGWASPDTKPTHIVMRFSSGHGGAYIGAPDAKLWIDNVKLVYKD